MTSTETAIKSRSDNCLMFKCPHFAALCGVTEDGTLYFDEGDKAYGTAVYCSQQVVMGIGNGACIEVQRLEKSEPENGAIDA